MSNTSNSSNNSNSNSSSSSINTSYAEYDSPLTSINNINSIIFNTDLDHDDFPLVQFYLSGKSSYAINQLKYNSWFYLKQHQNEIMSSFLSLNSLTFNKSINEFYNNNILLDLITQHKYINNKNLINNYNQNNPITTTTTNNNNNNNFQKNQKISTDRSESQLVFSYLIFGDGDLSFSKALVKLLQQYQQFYNNNCSKSSNNNISISVCNKYQVLSTIYDTKDKVTKKYNNAKENIQFIEKSGLGEMQYSVDVMLYRNYSIQNKYNVAIFNFPFADTVDHKKNTTEKKKSRQSADSEFDTMYVYKGRHMKLVEGFFHTCYELKIRSVVITLLLSQALVWEIERLASRSGYHLEKFLPLESVYHQIFANGYNRKRTYVDSSFPSTDHSNFNNNNTNNNRDINDVLSSWCFCFSIIKNE